MVRIIKKDDQFILECGKYDLLMLHQAFSEISHGTPMQDSELDLDLSSEFLHDEFVRLDKIYLEKEKMGFAGFTKLTLDHQQLLSYFRVLEAALREFEGELQTRTGVDEKEASKLLSALKSAI